MTQTSALKGAQRQPQARSRSTVKGYDRSGVRIDGVVDMSTRRIAPVATAPRDAVRRRPHKKSLAKSLCMYLFIAVLLGCLFTQISALAKITQNAKWIATIQTDIHEMRGESGNLTVRLGMQQNINRVRDEAIYRLGMVQPQAGQIRVVAMNVPTGNLQMQTAYSGGMLSD